MNDEPNQFLSFIETIDQNDSMEEIFKKASELFSSQHLFQHGSEKGLFCNELEATIRKESVLIAALLLDQKFKNTATILEQVSSQTYSLNPFEMPLDWFYEHVKRCLETLMHDEVLRKKYLSSSLPLNNYWSEQVIRESVRLGPKEKVTDMHYQMALLSAWLHPLRQNVGSCFATAPAIMIQQEQPHQFLEDLNEIMHVGVLRRTFEGNEHAVPISKSWGPASLHFRLQKLDLPKLSQSSELIYCLKRLKILEDHQVELQLLEKLKQAAPYLSKNPSLNEVITALLKLHFKMGKKDKKQLKPQLDLSHLELRQSSTKSDLFEENLEKAQRYLVAYQDHPLLKTWEYTFASFAETQSQFFKWNLYTSLGFDSKKPFSVAHTIYQYLEKRLEQYEKKIKHHQAEYEQEFFRVKMLEKRVMDSENETTAGWARVEYQNHLNEFNFHRRNRDEMIDRSDRLSKLLSHLLKIYDTIFPQYFQEVYDASMGEIQGSIYEDSPAGFRLLYKHGRQDPTLWSYIKTEEEFKNALKEFFTHTEFEVSAHESIEEFKQEYADIITEIVQLIQSDEFIYWAYKRIAERYHLSFPEHDFSQVEQWPYKPWCYISGGTMERLLGHYYKRSYDFKKAEKSVINPTELFSFVLDTLYSFSEQEISPFFSDTNRSLLMYSPNHAFLLKPGWLPLKQLWQEKEYSFTWIRDQVVRPELKKIQSYKISRLEINFFLTRYLSEKSYFLTWLQQNIQLPSYPITLKEFRERIASCEKDFPVKLQHEKVHPELLDHWFYRCFPLVNYQDLPSICSEVLAECLLAEEQLILSKNILKQLLNRFKASLFVESHELFELLCLVLALVSKKLRFDKDCKGRLVAILRKRGLLYEVPHLIADTNWPYFSFGFCVSPLTEQLEMWRLNNLGLEGYPMTQWGGLFQENHPSKWGILTASSEYRA